MRSDYKGSRRGGSQFGFGSAEKKLKTRHNYLETKIHSCIPSKLMEGGKLDPIYDPEGVTIVPGQLKKKFLADNSYYDVNRYNIRSQHAFFSSEKMPPSYENVVED